MPRPKSLHPGSCTLRLQSLPSLPPHTKTALLASIAHDIRATFIYIAKQAEAGALAPDNTAPLNDVLTIIKDTDMRRRGRLERRLERYERRIERLRGERAWMRREFKGVVGRVDGVQRRWRVRVGELRRVLEGVRGEYAVLRGEYALLQARLKQGIKRPEVEKGEIVE